MRCARLHSVRQELPRERLLLRLPLGMDEHTVPVPTVATAVRLAVAATVPTAALTLAATAPTPAAIATATLTLATLHATALVAAPAAPAAPAATITAAALANTALAAAALAAVAAAALAADALAADALAATLAADALAADALAADAILAADATLAATLATLAALITAQVRPVLCPKDAALRGEVLLGRLRRVHILPLHVAAALAAGAAQLSRRPWVRGRYLQSGDRDGQHSMLSGRRPRLIFVSSQPFPSRRHPSPTCHWTTPCDGIRRCVCERGGISMRGPGLSSMHRLRAPGEMGQRRRLLYWLRL